jgi:hypothetical protein
MGQANSHQRDIVMTPAEAAVAQKIALPHDFYDKPPPANWCDTIPRNLRVMALEFNRCMSYPPPHEGDYALYTYHSVAHGPKNFDAGGPAGSFTTTCMTPRMCDEFADALKHAQWPVDRVEKWGCKGVGPYTCRIIWKKSIDNE